MQPECLQETKRYIRRDLSLNRLILIFRLNQSQVGFQDLYFVSYLLVIPYYRKSTLHEIKVLEINAT